MWTLHGARVSGGQWAWVSANPVGLSQRRSGGHESEAGRRALSQQRSGGVISCERHAWGRGNPGTRQPAGGLGIAPAGGPNRARDQRTRGTRGDPAELPRIIRGLERDDEGDFLARETDRTQEQNKRLLKTKRGEWAPLTVRSGLLSRCTHEGGTGTRRRGYKLK